MRGENGVRWLGLRRFLASDTTADVAYSITEGQC